MIAIDLNKQEALDPDSINLGLIRWYLVLSATLLNTAPLNAFPLEYKMNEIVNKFLLAGYKFMPKMHLKQPGFTYSTCGPFTKNKDGIQKFKEAGDTNYIYKNELDKACFQHDMVYRDFKDLARRTASDKILRGKAFHIARNSKYDGCHRGLASMVYRFFDKKSAGSGVDMHANTKIK